MVKDPFKEWDSGHFYALRGDLGNFFKILKYLATLLTTGL